MKKVLLAVLVFFMFLFSISYADLIRVPLTTPPSTNQFNDLTSSHWAYETILKMKEAGILNGYEDGSFRPDQDVTREEFVQMMLKVTNTKTIDLDKMQNYYDVNTERWSYNAVQAFGTSIKETSDGYVYFYPTRPIQRQEVAKIVSDYYGLSNNNLDSRDSLTSKYNVKDSYDIDVEYSDAVYNVYEAGYMKGMSDYEFSPVTSLTRAQAATLLSRIAFQRITPKPTSPLEVTTPVPTEEPVENIIDLDMAFMHMENQKSNLIYSPLSIKYALKMLADGAEGTTKKEIDALVAHYNLTKYNSSNNLSLANGVFILDSYKGQVLDAYINKLKNDYNAEVKYDSFESVANMNKWIEEKTLHLIKNMLNDGDINPLTRMALINALAIDMEWQNKFDGQNTFGQKFTKEDNSTVMAEMMHSSSKYRNGGYADKSFGYYMDDTVQVYSKQLKEYDGERLEFVAVMPKTQSLIDYTNNLKRTDLDKLLAKIENIDTKKMTADVRKVNLSIPKFDFEYDLDLAKELIELGMKESFSNNADFSKMTGNKDLRVGAAKHKAKIEFSEDGIKAAAVTVIMMEANSALMQPEKVEEINIDFDKPFLFLIRDIKTNELWFVGTVYEPTLHVNK